MEPAQTERARNPGADKALARKSVRRKDKVEDAAGVVRVQAAAGVADKARAKVAVVVSEGKIVNSAQNDAL
jgi:hypothetical protein